MVRFNNPPQPVPTAIPNAVTYQERVSVLLNGAGSAKQNPIQSKNPSGTAVGANGHALRLSFGMADISESVVSAAAAKANDDGSIAGAWTYFTSSVVQDVANYRFTADLVVGSSFPEIDNPTTQDGDAQLVVISIKTNLNRTLNSQVWVGREPSDMVTFNGIVTGDGATPGEPGPLRLGVEQYTDNTTVTWGCQFYSSWNDEIARQHGASGVSLLGRIIKPYGGAATVEVYTNTNGVLNLVVEETPCGDVSTLSKTVTAAQTIEYVFRFRSKAGSATYLQKSAWVEFYECPTGTGEDPDCEEPPDIEGGGTPDTDPPGLVIYDPDPSTGSLQVNVTNMGGAANVDLQLQGFTGVHYDDSGTYRPAAGSASGTMQRINIRNTGTVTIGASDLFANGALSTDTDLIVVYAIATVNNVTRRSKPLVYLRNDFSTNTATDYPKPPTVTSLSFNFTTRVVTFTLTEGGWADSPVTVSVTELQGRIDAAGTTAQDVGDLYVSAESPAFSTTLSDLTTGSKTVNASGTITADADAVLVTVSNSSGLATGGVLLATTSGPKTSHSVKRGPTIGAASLATVTNTRDTLQIDLSDTGGQVGTTFSVYVQANWLSGSNLQNRFVTVTDVTYSSSSPNLSVNLTDQNLANLAGYYQVSVVGELGGSNVYQIDAIGS